MKPILLATDGSPSAEAATQEAIDLAQAFSAPLVVVSVVHPAVPPYAGYYGYPEPVLRDRGGRRACGSRDLPRRRRA
jgi:nucleotide-binding universal stress UspA family protein